MEICEESKNNCLIPSDLDIGDCVKDTSNGEYYLVFNSEHTKKRLVNIKTGYMHKLDGLFNTSHSYEKVNGCFKVES